MFWPYLHFYRLLSAFLSENVRPAKTLSGMPALGEALLDSAPDVLKNANRMLDHFKSTLDVGVCYLMDARGMIIASSNRNDPDSFVGKNFIFRPYFQKAIRGNSATYLALGTTSGKRGAYHSYPVYGSNLGQPSASSSSKFPLKRSKGPWDWIGGKGCRACGGSVRKRISFP